MGLARKISNGKNAKVKRPRDESFILFEGGGPYSPPPVDPFSHREGLRSKDKESSRR